jgi:ATP adenylyltransferase
MERLWSPWRLEYVTGPKSADCVFCLRSDAPAKEGVADGDAGQRALIVHEGRDCYVILNLYPYNNGHLMVVPRRHVATLAALTPGELQEIGVLTQRSEVALTEAYAPHGINVGVNLGKPAGAGVESHLHVHLVPRWNGDTNFMTVVGNMRVLPEDLSSSAARLRPIFARLAANAGAAS